MDVNFYAMALCGSFIGFVQKIISIV